MVAMDPLAFFIAHDATRQAVLGAKPWDRPPRRRRRRPANRAPRVR
jgi:hypothetical protein